MLLQDRDPAEHAARLERLLEQIESFPEPDTRTKMAAVVQGLVALYGEGLTRMLEIVHKHGETGVTALVDAFAEDDLVSHLLLLHDLHPVPVETRVARALESVRPYLRSHGGNVELLEVEGGVVKLRLQGSCHGCPSSTITLKSAIEEAIFKAAPEVEGIEAEGTEPPPASAFVPIGAIQRFTHCPAGGEETGSSLKVSAGAPAHGMEGRNG